MEEMEEFKIPEEAREKLKDPEVLRRQVQEGKTFQEIIGYSDETLHKFYGAACRLFERQEYTEAADAFIFLSTLNPYIHNFWLGLGMSEQLTGQYQAALIAYGMSFLTDLTNPTPHYHSANCYKQMGDVSSAISSLEMAVEYASNKQEHAHIKEQAEKALQALLPKDK